MKYLLLLIAVSLLSCDKSEDPTPMLVPAQNSQGYFLEATYKSKSNLFVTINSDTFINRHNEIGGRTSYIYIEKHMTIKYVSDGVCSLRVVELTDTPSVSKCYIELKNITTGTMDLSSLPE